MIAIMACFGFVPSAFATIDNTAQVSGSTPSGGTVTATSSEQVTIEAASPAFTLVKSITSVSTGSGADLDDPDGGDQITYQYALANTGNITLDGTTVVITDNKPTFNGTAGANNLIVDGLISGDANSDGNINPGETWIYRNRYILAQADVDLAAGVANGVTSTIQTASVDAVSTFGAATLDGGNSTLTASATITNAPVVTLAKIATRDGTNEDDGSGTPYAVGETVTYLLTVRNAGNVTLSSLTVSETAFSGANPIGAIVCSVSSNATIATLAPGGTETCTTTYTIAEGDL